MGVQDGRLLAEVESFDASLNECNVSAEYIIDGNKPEVSWISPSENASLEGDVQLKVNAKDTGAGGSGIDRVEIFSGFETYVSIGIATLGTSDEYTFDLNTFNMDNGRVKLKAVAYDKGSNSAESTVLVTVSNTLFQKSAAIAAIDDAGAKKQDLLESMELFSEDSPIFTQEFRALVDSADQNLEKANDLLSREANLEKAKQFADIAKSSYVAATAMLGAEKYATLQTNYEKESVAENFRGAGLKESFIPLAEESFNERLVSRKIDFYKAGSDDNEFYIATVTVFFTVLGDSDTVKVVEIIPKEFAQSATMLSSPDEFLVLKNDPVLSFGPVDSPRISYSLNRPLSKDEADELIEGEINQFFTAPPIVLPGDAQVDSYTVVAPFDLSGQIKPITDFVGSLDPMVWLIIGIVVLVLLIGFVFLLLAGIVIFVILRRRRF